MPIFATAGSKVYIGGPLEPNFGAALTSATFTGQTWTEIRPLESIGSVGDSAESIDIDLIGSGRRHKLKGVRDAGTMDLVAAIDYADAGQIALLAAEATNRSYAFRVVFNDAPPAGTPSERLFVGMVMSASEALDSANSVMKLNVAVAVNSNVVRIAADD